MESFELNSLTQGFQTVGEFYNELKWLMVRDGILESWRITKNRVINGLNKEIRRVVSDQRHKSLKSLIIHAKQVEKELSKAKESREMEEIIIYPVEGEPFEWSDKQELEGKNESNEEKNDCEEEENKRKEEDGIVREGHKENEEVKIEEEYEEVIFEGKGENMALEEKEEIFLNNTSSIFSLQVDMNLDRIVLHDPFLKESLHQCNHGELFQMEVQFGEKTHKLPFQSYARQLDSRTNLFKEGENVTIHPSACQHFKWKEKITKTCTLVPCSNLEFPQDF